MIDAMEQALAENRPVRVPPLAKRADVTPNTLYSAVRRGEVASVRIGRSVRIPAYEARRILGLDKARRDEPRLHSTGNEEEGVSRSVHVPTVAENGVSAAPSPPFAHAEAS